MRPSRSFVFVALLLLAFAVAACSSGSSGPPPSDIVSTIPWSTGERLTYAVKDKQGNSVGESVLAIATAGPTTQLSQSFVGDKTKDDSSVSVDSQTLKPHGAKREIVTPGGDTTLDVTYTDQGAVIVEGAKQSGLSVPDHSYDNDESLFLWRTVDLKQGYTASYTTIITNRRNREAVTLSVVARESVTVPAGTFDCWRLQIKAGGVTQNAWYANTPSRPLIKYDNDAGLIYELESQTGPGQAQSQP